MLKTQSDDRLVSLARRGNESAYSEIVRRYRQPLVAFASAYAPADRAEDVVQESLERAWTALRGSNAEIALKPWLYTIVRNRALNATRDARTHEPLDEAIDGVRQPSDIVLQREELSRVVAAVAALAPGERQALVDSALEGRTHDQIAAELSTTAGAVRGMIYRGRAAVRGAVGAVLPLPLVAALSGGAATGGGALTAAGGASLGAKGAAVAAVSVAALASGIAVERSFRDEGPAGAAVAEAKPGEGADAARRGAGGPPSDPSGLASTAGAEGGRLEPHGREGERSRDGEPGDGAASGDDRDGSGPDNSGPGSVNSGSGSVDSGSGSGSVDSGSGSVDSGSGSVDSGSGSVNSGSGSVNSGSGSVSSGSGSGSSGSGSSGSGSSGSDDLDSGGSDNSGSGSSGSSSVDYDALDGEDD